jgi:hypothetical protein
MAATPSLQNGITEGTVRAGFGATISDADALSGERIESSQLVAELFKRSAPRLGLGQLVIGLGQPLL